MRKSIICSVFVASMCVTYRCGLRITFGIIQDVLLLVDVCFYIRNGVFVRLCMMCILQVGIRWIVISSFLFVSTCGSSIRNKTLGSFVPMCRLDTRLLLSPLFHCKFLVVYRSCGQ